MTKAIRISLLSLATALLFASCSDSSSDRQLGESERNQALLGTYQGKRIIKNPNNKVSDIDNDLSHVATVAPDSKTGGRDLAVVVSGSNAIIDNISYTATNFTDHGTEYWFNLNKTDLNFTDASVLPQYIKNLTPSGSTIAYASIQLVCKQGAKFDINSRTLNFTYEGTLVIVTTISEEIRMPLVYSYVLNKK